MIELGIEIVIALPTQNSRRPEPSRISGRHGHRTAWLLYREPLGGDRIVVIEEASSSYMPTRPRPDGYAFQLMTHQLKHIGLVVTVVGCCTVNDVPGERAVTMVTLFVLPDVLQVTLSFVPRLIS